MSDNSKQFETTRAPSTSKRPPTRHLGRFPVPKTEFGGSNQVTKRIEAERDRPRNLVPTSHKTDAAKFTPDPDDLRETLRRSTERNTAPSPFAFQAPYTSRCVNTAGAANGHQTFQYRSRIERRKHKRSKSTLEYQPTPLGDRQESLEPLADEATTFLHVSQPPVAVELSGKLPAESMHCI
jgi:hypothetical protein